MIWEQYNSFLTMLAIFPITALVQIKSVSFLIQSSSAAGIDYVQVINSDQEVDTSPFVFSVQLLESDIEESFETFNLVLSTISADVSIDTNSSTASITITSSGGKFACAD